MTVGTMKVPDARGDEQVVENSRYQANSVMPAKAGIQ